ncbi:MAG TPA: cutinase family protein [Mycobacterium sp.]|nr:cutinase family protein [Mycobacterium sp.]
MNRTRLAALAGFAAASALVSLPIAEANAQPCSDVEVVFARGTNEPPGVGMVGQGFVDALSSRVGGRSVGVYAVNYPASDNYLSSAAVGSDDAQAHIQNVIASCPATKVVLGGYSQGAAVADLATAVMPPQTAEHVAAVTLFGTPSSGFSSMLAGGQPLPTTSPVYAAKTIDLCMDGDPICSAGGNIMAHMSYVQSGMTDQAATFAATKIDQH